MSRHVFNTLFYHNGIYFTLEECQLICSLRELSADDDTVSEIIKHERGSPEPVNCAGLDQNLLDTSFSTLAGQATFPIVWDVEAALVKARVAYRKWMEYMTGIIWESVSSLPLFPQQLMSYFRISDIRNAAGFMRSPIWLLLLFAGWNWYPADHLLQRCHSEKKMNIAILGVSWGGMYSQRGIRERRANSI